MARFKVRFYSASRSFAFVLQFRVGTEFDLSFSLPQPSLFHSSTYPVPFRVVLVVVVCANEDDFFHLCPFERCDGLSPSSSSISVVVTNHFSFFPCFHFFSRRSSPSHPPSFLTQRLNRSTDRAAREGASASSLKENARNQRKSLCVTARQRNSSSSMDDLSTFDVDLSPSH